MRTPAQVTATHSRQCTVPRQAVHVVARALLHQTHKHAVRIGRLRKQFLQSVATLVVSIIRYGHEYLSRGIRPAAAYRWRRICRTCSNRWVEINPSLAIVDRSVWMALTANGRGAQQHREKPDQHDPQLQLAGRISINFLPKTLILYIHSSMLYIYNREV